jgi:hypothetical protein
MDAGKPDPLETSPPPPSLAGRLRAALARGDAPDRAWWPAALLGGLIALGPVLTLAGAALLTAREQAAVARLRAELAPRQAAENARGKARVELGNAVTRPAMGATLDALAGVLPGEARLMRAERTRQGALEVDIATNDPDALRSAIRRAPALADLRNTSQRRSDAAMVVSLREEAR